MRYEVDPGAQLLDSINPNVEMDRSMGRYGGGANQLKLILTLSVDNPHFLSSLNILDL